MSKERFVERIRRMKETLIAPTTIARMDGMYMFTMREVEED
jgi:hypothetical protein